MPRGQEAKLRRRQNRKQTAEEILQENDDNNGNDDADSEEDDGHPIALATAKTPNLDSMPKKKSKSSRSTATITAPKKKESIKTGPLLLLFCLVGTTLLPALIYASDYFSKYLPNVVGNLGFRLGIGAVPRRRVTSFYEKHAPEKLHDVPTILSKHYGDYPTLIKKLERKYQDYGYFLGWQDDEAPLKLVREQLSDLYKDVWLKQWNRHAPQLLKTAARNVRYNLTFLYKKGRRLWKSKLWPWLEPILGVPAGTEKQKRQDAADARARAKNTQRTTTRRKNTDFRDEDA